MALDRFPAGILYERSYLAGAEKSRKFLEKIKQEKCKKLADVRSKHLLQGKFTNQKSLTRIFQETYISCKIIATPNGAISYNNLIPHFRSNLKKVQLIQNQQFLIRKYCRYLVKKAAFDRRGIQVLIGPKFENLNALQNFMFLSFQT